MAFPLLIGVSVACVVVACVMLFGLILWYKKWYKKQRFYQSG